MNQLCDRVRQVLQKVKIRDLNQSRGRKSVFMRNRQVIELLIYPKYFWSLAIPYKGKYMVRIHVYQRKLLNDKITHAYPKMGEFEDVKSLKQYQKGKVSISKEDVRFNTQTFFLYYSNEKVNLNTYATFKLQYDEIRQFKTYVEFELIRKSDSNVVEGGCVYGSKEQTEDQLICKQVYLLNSYKRLDIFERVYFQHYEFYCALDLYICTVSLGKVYRSHKFQLVEYINNPKLQKTTKSLSNNNKSYPSLSESVYSANQQAVQYSQLRKLCIKYQNLSKVKNSFLYQQSSIIQQQIFQDLSYLTYSYKDYEKFNIYEAIQELQQDKRMINDNIRYLFSKLPHLIKQIPLAAFKNLTSQSIKKKFDLRKKYLLKKVPHNSMLQKSLQSVDKALNPRKSLDNTTEAFSSDLIKSSYTFRENRKLQKIEFIHIRREQFIKSFQIINLKDCVFPMMLIEKSLSSFYTEKKLQIVMEVTNNEKKIIEEPKYDEVSLIVLIHGYQGSHHDLKKIKNYLEYLSSSAKILPITSIEKNINQNIEFLGEKVASEIQFFIVNSYENIKRIDFIGFSLGGVIARACLKHLSKYKDMMNTLITLASPHLGVSESQNTFVNFGVWYLSKIDKVKNIKELNFQSITEKDSFMMRLSQSDDIGWFKKVVLVSSSQDEFVPHYSARIMPETKNPQINKMAVNIISRIQNYERIEVWFDLDKKASLDKVIGRKSHIEFIENYSFLQMLCKIYQKDL